MLKDIAMGAFAYKNGESTIRALVEFIEEILDVQDQQEFAEIILCDLSKATSKCWCPTNFITISCYYGVRGTAYSILSLSLKERKQV